VCWTEAPEQLATLGRQRRRWQRGLWEGIRRHARMVGNPRYGAVGLVAMPYFLLFEFLSPLVALGGLVVTVVLWLLGSVPTTYFVSFLLVSIVLGWS
jgi:cellulose synthase/poly-beta-1,6-N-acetylglucosamine synthase-like glycosyltransferase